MRDRLILVSFALVVGGCFGHLVYPSGPFSGRVVDASTGQPLAGAAIVAVWRQEGPGPGHPTERLHDVVEVVADADGHFTLPRKTHVTTVGSDHRSLHRRVFARIQDELLQGRRFQEGDSKDRPLTIALTKPAAKDRRRFAAIPSGVGLVRFSKIPNLVRLVNIELVSLGLQPLYEDK